jgi:hypothetical protein
MAVHPDDEVQLLIATGDVLLASYDGGWTFLPVPDAPPLTILAWPTGDRLWGADATGTVFRSTDQGRSWIAASRLAGSPTAIAATDARLYAATDVAIYSSVDGSRWEQVVELS